MKMINLYCLVTNFLSQKKFCYKSICIDSIQIKSEIQENEKKLLNFYMDI